MEPDDIPGFKALEAKIKRLSKVLVTMLIVLPFLLGIMAWCIDGGDALLPVMFYSIIASVVVVPGLLIIYHFITFLVSPLAISQMVLIRVMIGIISAHILVFIIYIIKNSPGDFHLFYSRDWPIHLAGTVTGGLVGFLDHFFEVRAGRDKGKAH